MVLAQGGTVHPGALSQGNPTIANEKLDWARFDETTLPADLKRLYDSAKASAKAAGEARETLRKAMEKHMVQTKRLDGATQRLALNMKFGGLYIAKAEAEAPKASSKPTLKW